MKILVVDDNPLTGKLVSAYLGRFGWKVETCDGPFGAINKVREFRPDAVLVDLNMPGLSGYKLADLLKQKKDDYGYKLFSFSAEDEQVQEGLVRKGLVDGYYVKTNSLAGLVEVIGGCVPA